MTEIGSCAVYIDGDGVPYWLIEHAMRDLRERSSHVSARAYKNWTDPGNQRLMTSLWAIDVDIVQVSPHAGLSNGTDIAIAVDAVDTLHRARTEAVAIVGNDGDFSTLAHYLRRKGVRVLGYASRDASAALARECDHFTRYDSTTRAPASPTTTKPLDEVIAETIQNCAGHAGWVSLDKLGHALRATHGLQAKDVGKRSWSAYFESTNGFEYHRRPSGNPAVRIAVTYNDRLTA